MIKTVFKFNNEVIGIENRLVPQPLIGDERTWMVKVLNEEAHEFFLANDLTEQVDALVDSIIFAIGGLYRCGLSTDQAQACFDAVMAANNEKKKGQKEGRAYDGVQDAIKPTGWVGPEDRIQGILNEK